ncbi:DUF2169 domain-containing protein [Pantoea sp.]|uniref:DUF2169 family type VI secretion system accessory protein n=1 Tax=Pantoea sp. TaxID=69393 RepID=UPI0028977865|nr:DUF2169 domain-containing protein [Pantoea sp.]
MNGFINYTAFPALQYQGIDQKDRQFTIVVARVTYDIEIKESKAALKLAPLAEQSSLIYSDVPCKASPHSCIEFESDLAPYKPKTDVVIHAAAYAPNGKAASEFEVAAKVGESIKKLRIHGPRYWRATPVGWGLSPAKPIDKLDISYEYASGGCYEMNNQIFASPANPSGMGWYPEEYLKKCQINRLPAPQVESAHAPVKYISEIITPAGFGYFGKSWRGRIEFAGTYDRVWLEKRHPYLPEDFDFHYWCGAHPDLQIAHPQPCDTLPVELQGLISAYEIPDQRVYFHIPVETLFVFVKTALGVGVAKDMLLDTLVIDMRNRKVFCTYRVTLAEELEAIETELRYIATAERETQKRLAEVMLNNHSASTFIPLPSSLLIKR